MAARAARGDALPMRARLVIAIPLLLAGCDDVRRSFGSSCTMYAEGRCECTEGDGAKALRAVKEAFVDPAPPAPEAREAPPPAPPSAPAPPARPDLVPVSGSVAARGPCFPAFERRNMNGGFLDVAHAGGRLLVADAAGALLDASEPGLPAVLETGNPLYDVAVAPDGRVAAVGWGVVALAPGPAGPFEVTALPGGVPAMAAAWAGAELLVFDLGGRAHRTADGDAWKELELPARAAFAAAHFDGARGAVVGLCGLLLVTDDGGASYRQLSGPWDRAELYGVHRRGDDLWVAGQGGVWRGTSRGGFRRAIEARGCHRLAALGASVAVTCEDFGAGLFLDEGRGFVPVPTPDALHLRAVALAPRGELVAVGLYDQLMRGDRRGVVHAGSTPAFAHHRETLLPQLRAHFAGKPPTARVR